MKLKIVIFCIIVTLLHASESSEGNSWSWSEDSENPSSPDTQKFDSEDAIPAASAYDQGDTNDFNATAIEELVDDILVSKRQGRKLNGFDDLSPDDSNLQQALDNGNDGEARSIIKNRLCLLGLVKCNEDQVQGKHSYISPEELVYAQPVHIKPVGRPIPSIPIRKPQSGIYGPPRPIHHSPTPGKYGYATPPRRDYKPFHKPGYVGSPPVYTSPNPTFIKPVYEHNDYVSRPRPIYASESPYEFDGHKDKKKVEVFVNAQGGSAVTASTSGVQQHVHHHFHHDAEKNVPGAIGSSSFKPVSSDFSGVNLGSYGGQSIAGYGGEGLGSIGTVKPVLDSYDPTSFGVNTNFGTTVGSYGDSGIFKKEYNVDAGSNNALSNYGGGYRGESSLRSENYDCVCVPQHQCPAHHVFGRKDDLYLAIDPRNLKSDIEAQPVLRDVPINGSLVTLASDETYENQNKTVSKREVTEDTETESDTDESDEPSARQAYYGNNGQFGKPKSCGPRHVCCKKPFPPQIPSQGFNQIRKCGTRHAQGINGRIKNPSYEGDSEFGEYPWQVAILKKDPKESVYICGGTLVDNLHILTAAHCVKSYKNYELRVRLGEWDVNHDVEFYPYIEKDISYVEVHPEFYAGTLYNDIAILRMDRPLDWTKYPHISPACLPHPRDDYTGQRCWTTGWGKDAFGQNGKYQNILKEVDVPVMGFQQCQHVMKQTRLGYDFQLHPGFVCAGGEEGKDACKGDGGGPMVCERGGTWQLVGIVSWGVGCGERGVPGVYTKVAHYLDWIKQSTQTF
ncbi:uncharacterized protein LOC108735180 isoform X2 [Agrilus planipennis]|uniref:Phenoloxidase-activating factor 2 n=1 Tax=Agrilus planipennis TaxID=224129 RepID=A0A7F5RB83_AGRPL|nr:uncharacterized protein LOC108735180 isoform X2 [Agrilus planipennis]